MTGTGGGGGVRGRSGGAWGGGGRGGGGGEGEVLLRHALKSATTESNRKIPRPGCLYLRLPSLKTQMSP